MKREYLITKKIDGSGCNEESFKSLLKTADDLSISENKITSKNYEITYKLSSKKIEEYKDISFHLELSSAEESKETEVKAIENISNLIETNLENFKFNLVIIWDEVSNYHCSSGYYLINEVENLMRKFIFRFLIQNFGNEWTKKIFHKEFQDKTNSKDNLNTKENTLYDTDFSHLRTFLFDDYILATLEKSSYKKIIQSEDIEYIKKMTIPQSNWNRYFSIHFKDIDISLIEDHWIKLYQYRRKIAHNKLFSSIEYNKYITLANQIKDVLNQLIEKVEEILVPKEEKENIKSFADIYFQSEEFSLSLKKSEEAISKALSNSEFIKQASIFKSVSESIAAPFKNLNLVDLSKFSKLNNSLEYAALLNNLNNDEDE